jgi:hypothetical protein
MDDELRVDPHARRQVLWIHEAGSTEAKDDPLKGIELRPLAHGDDDAPGVDRPEELEALLPFEAPSMELRAVVEDGVGVPGSWVLDPATGAHLR